MTASSDSNEWRLDAKALAQRNLEYAPDGRLRPVTAKAKPAPPEPAPAYEIIGSAVDEDTPSYIAANAERLVTFATAWQMMLSMTRSVAEEHATAMDELRDENKSLKVEVAELKAKVAEAVAKSNENAFVLARLRELAKGDPGATGPMGPPGRDGRDGPAGPQGAKGSRGQRGFETTGWLTDEENYTVTPLYYDDSKGPTLNLRGMFAKFNEDTEGVDVDAEVERMALQRAMLEDEVERMRRGLPPR
jgi:hypothetical protein